MVRDCLKTEEPKETTYNRVGRLYNFDGAKARYYSVTTMLSKTADHRWIDKWRERVGNEEADRICAEATNFGERFHKAMEDWLTQGLAYTPQSPEDYLIHRAWNNACGQLSRLRYRHIASELPLYSDALQLAGRCDALGYLDEDPIIMDFKLVKTISSYNSYEDYRLQCTAYAAMVQERMNITCKKFVVLMTPKDGSLPYCIIDSPNKYFSKLRERILQFRQMILEEK